MALISCPKCGREDVSDSALSCPECGYNIKAHFEKLKEDEKNKKREETLIKEEERKKQKIENEKKIECPECRKSFSKELSVCPYCGLSFDDKENIDRLKDIRYMESLLKDKFFWVKPLLTFLFCLGISILWLWLGVDGGLALTGLLFSGGLTCIYFIILIITINDRNSIEQDLTLARTDYEKYKEIKRRRNQESIANLNTMEQEKARKDAINHPICPMCGSKNTTKISTMNRAVSVTMVGMASSKIGKQYQCKSCGFKW